MRVAITGGLGLQGSKLTNRLKEQGHYVEVFDNQQRGHNVCNYDEWQDIDLRFRRPDFAGFDTVYHLAAHLGGVEYTHVGHDHQMMLDNLQIDSNVIRAAIDGRVSKFIFASTACVYPVSKQKEWDSVLKESDAFNPVEPESGYGWAKLTSEVLLRKVAETGKIPEVSIFRLFNVYGPGEDYAPGSHAIPELLRKVLFDKEIEVFGDGQQGRCFLYVDDAIDAYMRALGTSFIDPINIGTDKPIRISALALKMMEMARENKIFRFNHRKPTGVKGRVPDLTRAKTILGWEPRTPLDEGLKVTMDWMRQVPLMA